MSESVEQIDNRFQFLWFDLVGELVRQDAVGKVADLVGVSVALGQVDVAGVQPPLAAGQVQNGAVIFVNGENSLVPDYQSLFKLEPEACAEGLAVFYR